MAETAPDRRLQRILENGVIAILRLNSIEFLGEIARALVGGGVRSIELTMTTPKALDGIALLARELEGSGIVGVGTVLDANACRLAVEAGAEFVVSPGFDESVHATAKEMGKLSMPGAMTPTEILHAWTAGADVVKIFPSAGLGPSFFRDVLAPLPHVKLMPTGGVSARNVGEWIKAGAVCVGAGSNLVPKDAVLEKDWATVTANAKAFVEGVKAARR